ncbi:MULTISPECIES: FAD-dependent oxidoreductase [Actinosynnema]|uniref:NAD(P)/FAD-dependent oxidoreductase n=1 Tax=Actinosynnema TaxID=40566 RepID=UPI0020A51C30|nr:FAD-dependent oxidoreductase [Actinosynnema pretiosum]MCP2092309.1 Glycine/D-amino acid oxidase (deaminating) [Actinosynnema pretiosum]
MKVGVVGGGIAGALLALRLRREHGAEVEVFTLGPSTPDASGVSGGLVRGYERDPGASRLAALGLAELRDSPELLEWTGYRETGSVYLLPPDAGPPELTAVRELLPGSAEVVDSAEAARRYGFAGGDGATAVVERHAGFLSPAGLRVRALDWLARHGATVRETRVERAGADTVVAGGTERRYDAVVVAAGAWTGALAPGQWRTKQIQFGVYRVELPGLAVFVDDVTGLFGRPWAPGRFLLGLGCDRWDVDPDRVEVDTGHAEDVTAAVLRRFGVRPEPVRAVASCDGYGPPGGLRLRVEGGVRTFAGGSGGSVKTVLAASRVAARELAA